GLLVFAYLVSDVLLQYTGVENNSALIYVSVVVVISAVTTGYLFGILASVAGTFCVNFFFMHPYRDFDFTSSGYPVALLSMLVAAIVVCTITTRLKLQTAEALERERHTRDLYEVNKRLAGEKTAIQVEAEKEKMRGSLLRAVSHDLRTPLTGILGASDLLLQSGGNMKEEENLKLAEGIKQDSEWLINLVENLLTVTRMNNEGAKIEKRPELASEVAAGAVMKMKKRFPGHNIALFVEDECLMTPMDPILITQVLVNILENAIRHSGDREGIAVKVFPEEDRVVMEVSDKGKGLPPEVMANLEEGKEMAGDRGHEDAIKGAGVGLSVCYSIVKAHGGRLEARNRDGGGTQVRVLLPLEKTETGEGEQEKEQ
ncbi:MAG: DUF4118 domain-containing protein, partial [Bacillota bacterium]|nr:DUF4118 domain-containing protein [Bacillota bacterium]